MSVDSKRSKVETNTRDEGGDLPASTTRDDALNAVSELRATVKAVQHALTAFSDDLNATVESTIPDRDIFDRKRSRGVVDGDPSPLVQRVKDIMRRLASEEYASVCV